MKFKQRRTMGNCKQSNIKLSTLFIQHCFNIKRSRTRALIKNSILWPMIQQSSHSKSLFFTSTQNIIPFFHCIQSILHLLHQFANITLYTQFLNHCINISACWPFKPIWISNLISKCSLWKIRSLRYIEQF